MGVEDEARTRLAEVVTASPDIGRLRKLALKATQGPWHVWRFGEGKPPYLAHSAASWAVSLGEENLAYIAALSPDVVLGLLDAMEAAEARVAALEDALRRMEPWALRLAEHSDKDVRVAAGEIITTAFNSKPGLISYEGAAVSGSPGAVLR